MEPHSQPNTSNSSYELHEFDPTRTFTGEINTENVDSVNFHEYQENEIGTKIIDKNSDLSNTRRLISLQTKKISQDKFDRVINIDFEEFIDDPVDETLPFRQRIAELEVELASLLALHDSDLARIQYLLDQIRSLEEQIALLQSAISPNEVPDTLTSNSFLYSDRTGEPDAPGAPMVQNKLLSRNRRAVAEVTPDGVFSVYTGQFDTRGNQLENTTRRLIKNFGRNYITSVPTQRIDTYSEVFQIDPLTQLYRERTRAVQRPVLVTNSQDSYNSTVVNRFNADYDSWTRQIDQIAGNIFSYDPSSGNINTITPNFGPNNVNPNSVSSTYSDVFNPLYQRTYARRIDATQIVSSDLNQYDTNTFTFTAANQNRSTFEITYSLVYLDSIVTTGVETYNVDLVAITRNLYTELNNLDFFESTLAPAIRNLYPPNGAFGVNRTLTNELYVSAARIYAVRSNNYQSVNEIYTSLRAEDILGVQDVLPTGNSTVTFSNRPITSTGTNATVTAIAQETRLQGTTNLQFNLAPGDEVQFFYSIDYSTRNRTAGPRDGDTIFLPVWEQLQSNIGMLANPVNNSPFTVRSRGEVVIPIAEQDQYVTPLAMASIRVDETTSGNSEFFISQQDTGPTSNGNWVKTFTTGLLDLTVDSRITLDDSGYLILYEGNVPRWSSFGK